MENAEKSRRILVIEDDLDSVETLKLLLEMRNHSVETALDGKSGVEKALDFLPEIVICDIGLPDDFDGYQVAEVMRNHENLKSAFLIALSGYGQKEDVHHAIEAGFDAHLVKPPDFDKLFGLIENFTV